jgi:hypothetical protein
MTRTLQSTQFLFDRPGPSLLHTAAATSLTSSSFIPRPLETRKAAHDLFSVQNGTRTIDTWWKPPTLVGGERSEKEARAFKPGVSEAKWKPRSCGGSPGFQAWGERSEKSAAKRAQRISEKGALKILPFLAPQARGSRRARPWLDGVEIRAQRSGALSPYRRSRVSAILPVPARGRHNL